MRYSAPVVLILATVSPLSFASGQRLTAPALNAAIPARAGAERYRDSSTTSGASDWESNSDGWSQAPGFLTEAPSHREPALAGMLSFLIPFGTGSFYAGNVSHGAIHLAVGAGAALLFLNNFCVDECSNTNGEDTKAGIGFAVFVANWVAGTIVAVHDAKSFNRRHANAAAMVLPIDRLTAPAFSSSPSNGRFVFRLVQLSF